MQCCTATLIIYRIGGACLENLWEYTDGLFQSKEPVFVASMGGKCESIT